MNNKLKICKFKYLNTLSSDELYKATKLSYKYKWVLYLDDTIGDYICYASGIFDTYYDLNDLDKYITNYYLSLENYEQAKYKGSNIIDISHLCHGYYRVKTENKKEYFFYQGKEVDKPKDVGNKNIFNIGDIVKYQNKEGKILGIEKGDTYITKGKSGLVSRNEIFYHITTEKNPIKESILLNN